MTKLNEVQEVSAEPVAHFQVPVEQKYFCEKCGYRGDNTIHDRPGTPYRCAYMAWETVRETSPQPCPKCADGMVVVTKEDANNYCQILTLLGMEEEGSPVEEVKRLISLHEGMTCGDCNDTGWLENREEGRYPCTCMTEAEPYQLLEAERDDWKSRYESNAGVLG